MAETHIESSCSNENLPGSATQRETGKHRIFDSFSLKVIAIIGMTCNHFAWIYHDYLPFYAHCILIACGGVSFPLLLFLLAEGYRHTSNVNKYLLRLFIFALIAQVPFWLYMEKKGDVLFTLFICLAIMLLHEKMHSRLAFWTIFVALTLLSSLCDWGIFGPLMVIMLIYGETPAKRIAGMAAVPTLSIGLPYLFSCLTGHLASLSYTLYALLGCPTAIPLLLNYNGKRGRRLRMFFYWYYPLHIAVLGLLKNLL